MKSLRFTTKSSVFLKLFGVLALVGICIALVLGYGLRFAVRPHFDDYFHKNGEQYARYLARDIGSNFERAKQLAHELGIGIRIEGEGWSWVSSTSVPDISDRSHPLGPPPGPPFGLGPPHEGPSVVIDFDFPKGRAKMLVVAPKRPQMETNISALSKMLSAVALILLASYAMIRWVLSPIYSLNRGVEALGEGDLKTHIAVRSSDELGRLANAFNAMVVRVREMIASKQQLLFDVSHELRSPLTRAKLGLELLEEQTATTSQIRDDIKEVEQMIDELLEVARLESGHGLHPLKQDIVRLANDCVSSYAAAGKPVHLVDAPDSLIAPLDETGFRSVLRNLIDNALKYSPPSSDVKVFIRQQANTVRLQVQDAGAGIAPDEIQKVFEPFYRVDKSRTRLTGGYGLGLNLCKKIVEAHGGTIELQSEMGKGTTAVVILPLIS